MYILQSCILVYVPSDSRKDIDINTTHSTPGSTEDITSDKSRAEKYRLGVAEGFERSDLPFCAAIKQATSAVEFHQLLRLKLKAADASGDRPLKLRLLRHMAGNKQYAFQEQEDSKESND